MTGRLAALLCTAALAATARADGPPPPAEFATLPPAGDAPLAASGPPAGEPAAPESDATLRDPFDPRLRFDLPGLSFRPLDAGDAAPAILGVDARRVVAVLGGVRISSILAHGLDESFWSHLTAGPLTLQPTPGPDAAALRGDALAGSLELQPPDPPANLYRPETFDVGARLGWAGDLGGPAGHLRAGVQTGAFQATAALAGALPGLAPGLSIDDARMGEALGGDALFDLRDAVTDDDVLRLLLRLDGSAGLVRGGTELGRGFLRIDGARDTLVEGLYRHGTPGPSSVTAWALARTANEALEAFDPPADRWSRADDTLWAVAGGAAATWGAQWWTLELSGELRAEGVAAALSRWFVHGARSWDDEMGDWPYRPRLDGANRAGGTLGLAASFQLGPHADLRTAVSLLVYRLFLPDDPFGAEDPADRFAATERWEVEPAADVGARWRIGEGLELDARFETGARPADLEQLTAAGIDPAAGVRWLPTYALDPERSYGGQVGLRFESGIVDLRLAYHVQWIDGAITAGPAAEPRAGAVLPATWRNTQEFVQGGALSGTVYLARDWPIRFLLESSHGWAGDGWGGDYRPLELAPLSFLLEVAYRPPEGDVEAGVYGGYRWRPASWDASPVERRLAAACSLSATSCDERDTIPAGLYVRWAFWRSLSVVARASGLSFQGDGPTVQGFLTAAF